MKKYLLILIFGALAVMVNAQTLYESHVHIGGRAGATLSSIAFSPNVEQSMVPGFTAGVSFRYAEERHVGLIAEFNVTQRGWKESFDDGEPFKYSRTLTYLEIPLMTHIFFGSQRFKGFVNLGPEVSYMIGSSVNSNFDYKNVSAVPNFPLKNRMTGGIGMEYKINRKHSVTLEGRYYFGLGNIYPSSKKDVFASSRHSSIMVSLGYYFRMK